MAYDLKALGHVYAEHGRSQEAEKTLKRAIALCEEKMAHTEVWAYQSTLVRSLSLLGNLYNDLGRYSEAQPLLERAVTLTRTSSMPERVYWDDTGKRSDDYLQVTSLEDLANVYFWQDKYSQAEPLARKALELREASLPADHPAVARSLGGLGRILTQLGRPGEAVPLLERAFKLRLEKYGADSVFVATPLQRLADAYEALGRDTDAIAAREKALAIQEKKQPGTSAHAVVLNDLALGYKHLGRLEEARSMLNHSVEINTRERGADHPETATSLMNLGTVEVALGNFARGEELELRALEIRKKSAGVPSVAVAFSFENLGWLYQKQKRYEKAERYYRDGLAAFEATLGPDHPSTAACRKYLVGMLRESGKVEAANALAAAGKTAVAP